MEAAFIYTTEPVDFAERLDEVLSNINTSGYELLDIHYSTTNLDDKIVFSAIVVYDTSLANLEIN